MGGGIESSEEGRIGFGVGSLLHGLLRRLRAIVRNGRNYYLQVAWLSMSVELLALVLALLSLDEEACCGVRLAILVAEVGGLTEWIPIDVLLEVPLLGGAGLVLTFLVDGRLLGLVYVV